MIVKRLIDIVFAGGVSLIFSPVIAIVAILILVRMGPPVLFRQTRPGLKGKPFDVVKFRTMRDAVDNEGIQLSDAERLTALGKVLRRTSLDELPQLWNVLKGEMSLVGPRPLLERYTQYFTEEERLRFNMRPGITGWAQVNGRNTTNWNQRLAYDVWYVKNWSLLLDIRIMFMTIGRLFRKSGVVTDPRSLMLDLDEERSSNQNS